MGKFNLIFEHLQLKDCYFKPQLRVTSYFKLLLSNTLLALSTLGLAYPWIAVRMARYQLHHIHIIGDIEQFSGTSSQDTNALGEEIGSAFDLEIGF